MTDALKSDFLELLEAYEAMKKEASRLKAENFRLGAKVEEQKKQIEKLKSAMQSQGVGAALTGASRSDVDAARERIDRLLEDIHYCISILSEQ